MTIEIAAIRIYWHCGWAIQVDPRFESETLHGGETLRMFDEADRRAVYLSSMIFRPRDGKPFTVDDVIELFPPKDMTGLRYEHRNGELGGAGLWMFGEDDAHPTPTWVLMAMMACPSAGKVARCTVVCSEESDRDWAVAVWRSIVRSEPPAREGTG